MSETKRSCTRHCAIRYDKFITFGRVLKRLLYLGSKTDSKVSSVIKMIAILVRTNLKHSILRKSVFSKRDFARNKRNISERIIDSF